MATNIRSFGIGTNVSNCTTTSLSNSTTETAVFSDTIYGGAMGLCKELNLKLFCTITSTLTPPALTLRFKYGSAVLTILNALTINSGMTNQPFILNALLVNLGTTNSQFVTASVTQNSVTGPLPLTTAIYPSMGNFTIDSTVNQIIQVTAQFGSVVTSTSLAINYASYKID